MDKAWYHRLLIGSVYHAMAIEERWKHLFPEFQLSNIIKGVSAFRIFGKVELRSSQKISRFYQGMILILLISSGVLLANNPNRRHLSKLSDDFNDLELRRLSDLHQDDLPATGGIVLVESRDSIIGFLATPNIRTTLNRYRVAYTADSVLNLQVKYMTVSLGRGELEDYINGRFGHKIR